MIRFLIRGITLMHVLRIWKSWAKHAKTDIIAIFLAVKDNRIPWYTKALAILVVGYAFSPIDLVPDFIPVLGYLDDLIVLPFGIKLVLNLIPKPIMDEYREKAVLIKADVKRKSWIAAGIIITIWIAIIISLIYLFK